MPDCALEGRKAVDSYAVIEANDGVFVYFPSKERPEPSRTRLPEEFSDPAWSSFLCMGRWELQLSLRLDNFADPMHACYLHAELVHARVRRQAGRDADREARRRLLYRPGRAEGRQLRLDRRRGRRHQVYCRLDIPYPAAAGPGGPSASSATRRRSTSTPAWCSSGACGRSRGIARESWRFLYRATLEARHWNVLEQDREMLQHSRRRPQARDALPARPRRRRMRRTLTQQVKDSSRPRRWPPFVPRYKRRNARRAHHRRDRRRARGGAGDRAPAPRRARG